MTVAESTVPRSRRALLTAALGAAAAAAGAALVRPSATLAAENDPMVVGGEYTGALSPTGIATGVAFAPGTPAAAFYASTTTSGVFGLRGTSLAAAGVRGDSTSSYGVHGRSTGNIGVWAEGVNYYGLYASSAKSHALVARSSAPGYYSISGETIQTSGVAVNGSAANATGTTIAVAGVSYGDAGYGVVGRSYQGSVGVLGVSHADSFEPIPAAPPKTGVYGRSTIDSGSRGVHGHSTSGRGVFGQATSGAGLYGSATTGYALRTSGRVRLDKSAGIAILPAAATSVTVTPGITLTSNSAITATLMSDAGAVLVRRVSVNAAGGQFTIHFTGSAPLGTKVAWHVFG